MRLNILHGTAFGADGEEGNPLFVPDGTLIGEYKIHYEDRTSARIPILYGRDVRDWRDQDRLKGVTRGALAWQGMNGISRYRGERIFLYVTTWDNPFPRKMVTHVDYESVGTVCAPFCVALTAEGDGLRDGQLGFYHDFRNDGFKEDYFKLVGTDAAKLVKFEKEGLRITRSAEQGNQGAVGIATRFRVIGDFEITTSYELLSADQPKTRRGVGFEIWLGTESAAQDATSFYREVQLNGAEIFVAVRLRTENGARVPPPGANFNPCPRSGVRAKCA